MVDVLDTVDCFTGSNSFVVVFEGETASAFGGLLIVIAKYSTAFRSRSPQMSGDLFIHLGSCGGIG